MNGPAESPERAVRAWGTLDRGQIVAAALEIACKDGIEGLTIRRLAEAVGASRMGLYRHVRDKDEIIDLVADEISLRAIPGASGDDTPWQDRLRSIANSLRDRLTENPAFVDLMIRRSLHGKGGIAMAELITRTIASTGLPAARVAHYCLVFTDIGLGRVQRETVGDPVRAERNRRLIEAAIAAGDAPFVARYAEDLYAVRPDDVFASEVGMVIAAIEAERHGTT